MFSVVTALEENGATGFGADDGVPGVFHHGDAVGDADSESAAAAALAAYDADDGGFEAAHFHHVDGDGLGLAALFGADAGVGAAGVDEGDDGEAVFFGELHAAEGFAVAFGVGHSPEAFEAFFGVAAFLVADEHDLVSAEAGESAEDGGVVAECAVAVDLAEVAADHFDVVFEERALGVAGDLDGFPGGQVVVGFSQQRGVVEAKMAKLFGIIHLFLGLEAFEFVDLFFELEERAFEIEGVARGVPRAV